MRLGVTSSGGRLRLLSFLLPFCCGSAAVALENPWFEVEGPLPGNPRMIGGYTAGCIQGAVSLLPEEGDFQLMRKSRRRYFAHPQMRDFIKHLATEVKTRGYGKLLVGDQGQPRGGPTTTGHASHQTGLDGDFWFWLDSPATERRLNKKEEENLSAISMLNAEHTAVNAERFKDKHVKLLQYVTAQPGVERVFVHPAIKKALCERTDKAAWLNRIRPWWGHHYHFHVRLRCPEGQPDCKPQQAPPGNHGCGAELDWWFSEEAAEKLRRSAAESSKLSPQQKLAKKLARVPEKCRALLE